MDIAKTEIQITREWRGLKPAQIRKTSGQNEEKRDQLL